ncbi:hypothetical protein, partial [Escherichia coli]|uniref:hypothetical protein n=1 Tax=Escherichia coli TaxID=562 RepID=UPI001962E839
MMRKFFFAAATLAAMFPFSASADRVKLENGYIFTDGRVSSTRIKDAPHWFVLCDQDTITDLKSCTIQY